jgi:hypothetical protein
VETAAIFSIVPPQESADGAGSRLLRSGRDTGTVVPGVMLEAQLALGDEHLLFLTHDIPFEEQLEICLLDRSDKLVDRVWLAGANTTGNFRNLVTGVRGARFDFFGTRQWRVTVLDRPRFFLPVVGLPLGAHRRFGFCRRVLVDRV